VNCGHPKGRVGGIAAPLVPVLRLSLPQTFRLQTVHKCAGNTTTMGADCSILDLTPQRILIGVCVLFGSELVAIDCTHSLQKLALLNVIPDPTVSSNKGSEVGITFAAILQKVYNFLGKLSTKMRSKFRQNDILKGYKFCGFGVNNWRRLLRRCLTQTDQEVGDLRIGAGHLNGGAVVGDGDGFHGEKASRRQWCAVGGSMPPQNRLDQPPLCHLANWHSIGVWWVVLLYLMRTTSTNGGRVSLLNNTSPRNLPKNNNKKRKKDRTPPRSLESPTPNTL